MKVNSPRTALQQAYALELIENEKVWLEMAEHRNLTTHTYERSTAHAIYDHCKIYCVTMGETYQLLKKRFNV